MVLRKRAPPHLHNLNQGNARYEPRYTLSRSSPTSLSVSSPSPKRLTRPSRAQSSPHPSRIPSQESIFSPDLNTSPAFDLMSLEQAQRSPIRTSSADNPNPWAEELVENPSHAHPETGTSTNHPGVDTGVQDGESADSRKGDRVPPIVLAGTQRRMAANEPQLNQGAADNSDWEYLGHSPPAVPLQSNNPFLKAAQNDTNAWEDRNSRTSSVSRDDASRGLGQDEGYIPMTARLSLFDQELESEYPWVNEPSHSTTQPSQGPGMSDQQTGVTTIQSKTSHASFGDAGHAPLQIQLEQPSHEPSPGTLSAATTGSSHVLIDFDEPPRQESNDDNQTTAPTNQGDRQSARQNVRSDDATFLQELNRTIESGDSDDQQEKRAETYSIRRINWKDSTGKLCDSPMLIQNKNGPCPLLALVNALTLRAASQTILPPIVRALRTREQISLGLLIEALFDELTTHLGPDDELPDIEALSRFLTMLHTGMNVNPQLTLESNAMAGTFLQTDDIKFYSAFGIPLVHGWIASPSAEASAALNRIGKYHEDIQLLPFRKQELEDRVFQGAALTPDEERVMADIQAIQEFTDVEHATQLSPFGLQQLSRTLQPGSLSILFRNDHFSTLYKHPRLQQLFSLVTDAGYSSHAEVVWESLVDVNGSNTGFYAGDFRLVSQHTSQDPDPSGPRTSSNNSAGQTTTLSAQEQADADYAYALSLQYQEEEQRQPNAPNANSTTRARSASAANLGTGTRSSTTNVPPPRHQSYQRHSQSHFPSSAPGNENPEDGPPPSYEQASKSPAYSPPQRSPNYMDTPARSPYERSQAGRYPERGRDRSRDCIVM